MKVPYTQQFSPQVTPLNRLLPILRTNDGKPNDLKKAIAAAFFNTSADPQKMAGNTLIALRHCGILGDGDKLTDLGQQLIDNQNNLDEAHKILARQFLLNLDGIGIVETLREMSSAGIKIELKSLPGELRQRGFDVLSSSSDLSGFFGWLRQANVLQHYTVNSTIYYTLIGTSAVTLEALKDLNGEQLHFLKAMAALNVQEWTPYNVVIKHAQELYSGEIQYNEKMIVKEIIEPLVKLGFIQYRKKAKIDQTTPTGRGGKPADVKPTEKFEKEVADPLINVLYRAAGFTELRKIRSMALADIIADIKQKKDTHKQGKALELLAIRLCQMLDLQFMGWRETDVKIAGGGEVDAMLYSSRLIYSRWQVQCKIGNISAETVMKEVGLQKISLANVILVVSTSTATSGAQTYRKHIISTTNLNIIFLDGSALERIIQDNSALVEILRQQAEFAMNEKPGVAGLKKQKPSEGGNGSDGTPNSPPSSPASDPWNEDVSAPTLFSPAYSTGLGRMYCGDSLDILPVLINKGFRAKLIMTSPPFALVKKKAYGNEDSESYVRWFEQFVPLFKQILEPNGSVVIDIGGAWIKGIPAKSIYQYKLLVRLCESGFYLAQEFYHFNPAKLPTPAEWVTVRRLRVKDAMNNVFWLTLDPFADADNRRVLTEYSDSMKSLLKNGYKSAMRPSGHDISDKFKRDNGGAIPPNLLQFSNTESNSHYLRRCKEENLKAHPARFPQALPEFFIKFLTSPGDVILDPFAGSNVTGAAAEKLSRRWMGIEIDPDYIRASQFRFESQTEKQKMEKLVGMATSHPLPLLDYSGQNLI